MHEGIPIINYHVPKAFVHEDGKLIGMRFEIVEAVYDAKGRRTPGAHRRARSVRRVRRVLVAVGQENAFPWIERDAASSSTSGACRCWTRRPSSPAVPQVFFGGDAAFGPKNIITAVAHGHEAAVSIDRLLNGEDVARRPPPMVNLMSQKMGIHEWSYDNAVSDDLRFKVPWAAAEKALASIRVEVELGFDAATAFKEAERCLNCDVQTVFTAEPVHRMRRLRRHLPDGLHHLHRQRRRSRPAHAAEGAGAQPRRRTCTSRGALKTGRVMVKDEDVCLHCGLCAERCPTGAWDMQKFLLEMTQAGPRCRRRRMRRASAGANGAGPGDRQTATADEAHRGGQRLRRQVRQRQRLGFGVGQRAVRQGHHAHGRAGEPAQHLPQQHPGPAHLVRSARQRKGLSRPARRHRHDGGDEPADLGRGRGRDRARRLPVLRQHAADAARARSATTCT